MKGICQSLIFKNILSVFCLMLILSAALSAGEIQEPGVAILVSRDIKPYIQTVEGISIITNDEWRIIQGSVLSPKLEVFSLEKFEGKRQNALKTNLIQKQIDLFIAVGPESARFIAAEFQDTKIPLLYTMILNPEEILEKSDKWCGIPLSIPVKNQLEKIACTLPSVKKLGLLYDPVYNDSFFKEAYKNGMGLNIIPLEVSSKKQIPLTLKEHWNKIDSVWIIPDRTVISESIVQYIIKEALLKNKPVIGYNRFFYESGAALAFVFDYEEIGVQTAKLALNILAGKSCQKYIPEFQTWLNSRVINKIEIKVNSACGIQDDK